MLREGLIRLLGEHDAEVEQVDEPVERVAGAVVAPAGAGVDGAHVPPSRSVAATNSRSEMSWP